MILKLGWYWNVDHTWNYGAKLLIENSRIKKIFLPGQSLYETVSTDLDVTQKLVLPGFINAHCHLELTHAGSEIASAKSFPEWVAELQKLTQTWDEKTWESSYASGVRMNVESGTTRVLDVGNRDWSSWLQGHSLADKIVCFQKELLGIRPTAVSGIAELNADYCSQLSQHRRIIPHSPYSVSSELFAWIQSQNRWLNIHLSESREEDEFFHSHRGKLFDFVKMIYPEFEIKYKGSPFRYLQKVLNLNFDQPLITHANTLSCDELSDLTRLGGSVVHCPGSRAYFDHPQNNWLDFIRSGGRLCLGTDSLASNSCLSMWHELELFHKSFPELTEAEMIQTVTNAAADAISYPLEGRIQEGAPANLQFLKWDIDIEKPPSLREMKFKIKPHQVMHEGTFYESK